MHFAVDLYQPTADFVIIIRHTAGCVGTAGEEQVFIMLFGKRTRHVGKINEKHLDVQLPGNRFARRMDQLGSRRRHACYMVIHPRMVMGRVLVTPGDQKLVIGKAGWFPVSLILIN
ncbi:hypothetical protein D3C77_335070 [compost metagenome]